MLKSYYIYKATCSVTGMSYIGFTDKWPKRKSQHLTGAYNKKQNSYWYQFSIALREHGPETFTWMIVYQGLDCDYCLNVMENHFIKEYNSYYKWENGGYNMTLGGGNPTNGLIQTPEHVEKRVSKIRGRSRKSPTEYTRNLLKIISSKPRPGSKGKQQSKETIAKKIQSTTKTYILIEPNGTKHIIQKIKTFCRLFNQNVRKKEQIHSGPLIKVAKGTLDNFKGWKCFYS